MQAVAQKFFYNNGTQPMLFASGLRPDIPLSCPTSNCTWEPYETLGACSACEDVSYLLKYACLTARQDWIVNDTTTGKATAYPNATMCGYFLNATSESPVLMSGHSVDDHAPFSGAALLMRALPLVTVPERKTLYGGSINSKDIRNPIADVLIVGAANGSASSVYAGERPVAHECVLYWCVKTIKSAYFWAKYEEEVTHAIVITTAEPHPWKPTKFTGPKGTGITYLYAQDIVINTTSGDDPEFSYGLSNDTAVQTIIIFDDVFPSFTTVENASAEPKLRYKTKQKGAAMSRSLVLNPWIPPNNVTRHMERLATALTNVIRSSSSHKMFYGEAYDTEIYVAVRLWWLVLPLCLLAFSLIFLVATVIKTSREKDQVGVWKTSAVATLLYGFPDDMQKQIASSKLVGTPRAKAKELKVKLMPKMGWRASGNLLSPFAPNLKKNEAPPGWIEKNGTEL